MEESHKDISSEETTRKQTAGRRKILKMMAATAGAMGASILWVGKWTKPLVEVITLPAHAETSAPLPSPSPSPPPGNALTISDFDITVPELSIFSVFINEITEAQGDFTYSDESCEVDDSATLQYTVSGGGKLRFKSGTTLGKTRGKVLGDTCNGLISFPLFANEAGHGETLTISLGATGRFSNSLKAIVP